MHYRKDFKKQDSTDSSEDYSTNTAEVALI